MFVHRRKLLSLYIAATLVSGHAAAVGLGDLSLQSYLGKPLQAEVALSHMGDLTVDQLKVQIGSEADYSALGVEYNYLHSRLKIEPFVKNGQNYVRISTTEPISEPYLDFVLNLRWPQGQVVREFTVLLDPAPHGGSALASTAIGNVAPAADTLPDHGMAAVATEPQVEASAQPQPVPRPVRTQRSQSKPRSDGGSYVTQRGDSLWLLAKQLRPSTSVSVEQMMAALQAANPDAFINGNAARLKEAVTLDVAAAERIAAGGAAPAATTSVAATASGSAVPSSAANPAPSAQTGSAMPAESAQLAQENATLKAQVADLSQNVSHLNDSLLQSTERLHEMEARLDNVLQQFQQQRAPAATAEHGAIAQAGSMINQVNAAELAPAPKAHTPWWVHLLYWSGIAAAAGWAVREHFWPARRLALAGIAPSNAVSNVANGVNNSRVVERNAAASGENVWGSNEQYWQHPAGDSELTLDLPEAPEHAITDIELDLPPQTDDPVDPSISAGVFVAFGRFDEAERLLREAVSQSPERIDLKLQLLDVYVQSNQADAFEHLAQSIEQGPATPETLAELAVLRDSYQTRG